MSESKKCPQLVMLRIDADVPLLDLFKAVHGAGLALAYDAGTGGLQVNRVLSAPPAMQLVRTGPGTYDNGSASC